MSLFGESQQVAELEGLFAGLRADVEALFMQAPSADLEQLSARAQDVRLHLDEQVLTGDMLLHNVADAVVLQLIGKHMTQGGQHAAGCWRRCLPPVRSLKCAFTHGVPSDHLRTPLPFVPQAAIVATLESDFGRVQTLVEEGVRALSARPGAGSMGYNLCSCCPLCSFH